MVRGARGGKKGVADNCTPRSSKQAVKPATSVVNKELANKIRYDKCPCGKSDETAWMIKCTRCPQDWHSNCVNLKGISEDFVTQLMDWKCPLCFTAPGAVIRDNQRMESILLQMSEICGHNKTLQDSIVHLENRLSSVASDTDFVRDNLGQISQKVLKISDIELHMQHQLHAQSQLDARMKTIITNLAELQTKIQEFQTSPASSAHGHTLSQPPTAPVIDFAPPQLDHDMSPTSAIIDSFIDEPLAQSIITYLGTCTFKEENGHSVTSCGHPYTYTGSKSSSNVPPIPAELQPLFDSLNGLQSEIFYDKYPDLKNKQPAPIINSCLINRYNGPESFLPQHSDQEVTIHPESSIFSLSLGETCEIKFTERDSGDEVPVTCKDRSMYHMTRKSQDFFEHRIEKGSVTQGTRYSLTFRAVDWRNRNVTCVVGDSNTGHLAYGANKFNSFGELMPGQRFWAPCIDDINPTDCCSYNNVIIMCGINDLKQECVRNAGDIRELYGRYKSKIASIRKHNRKANISVVPILPTKSHELNKRALSFNSLIFDDLERSGLGVSHVMGLDDFLDNSGLLSGKVSKQVDRHGRPDMLHLNETGTRRLAGMIKRCIFLRLNGGIDKRKHISRVNGEPYSKIAGRPPTPRWHGGGSYQV